MTESSKAKISKKSPFDPQLATPHIGAQVSDIPRHQSEIITGDIIAYCKNEELKNTWKRTDQ